MTDIASGDTTKEVEALRAFKRYTIVNAVLTKSVGGGGQRENRNANLTEELMSVFLSGGEEDIW